MLPIKQLVISILIFMTHAAMAEVISIDNPNKGFLNSSPTLTFYMQGQNSKALILLLPGGEGILFLKPNMTELNSSLSPILKRLTDPSKTSGQFDIAVMDSPYSLKVPPGGGGARGSFDHIKRVESVVKYYREKTHLPIILMGHSNGTISINEFVKYIQANNKTDLLSGLILSGTRNEVSISPPIDIPIIFMHHEKDGCEHDSFSTDMRRYEKVADFNKSATSFITIKTGNAVLGDPCHSGLHMYFNADDEVSQKLDESLSKLFSGNQDKPLSEKLK